MANVVLYSQIGSRPYIWRSISCYVLARWIEEHGYTCQVIEFTNLFSPEELVEYTKMFIDESTMLIGASSTMWTDFVPELQMRGRAATVPENINYAIKELKGQFPNVKTIVGGQGTYVGGLDIFDYVNTEYFGEDSLLKLLDELSNKTMVTKMRRQRFDISSHRFVYKDHDCILPGEMLPIEWGRGCIFKCPFCRDPNLGKKPGTDEKDISLMVDEFTEMHEKFGTSSYYFIDETFNASKHRLRSLEQVYDKLPFKLEFLSYNRADLLDANPWTQDVLHNCGQRGTLMGIETFHPSSSKLISKPWSAKRGKDFLLELREKWSKTHIDVSFISGFPEETEQDLYDTANWLSKSDLGFYWFLPLGIFSTQQFSELELNSLEYKINFPDKQNYPNYWTWGNTNFDTAYKQAIRLNRYMKVHSKMSMWTLGPLVTMGLTFDEIVNKGARESRAKLGGDLYVHEARLFNLYKEKLKSVAGR